MPSSKLIVGGASAAAVLGIRVARSLHGRWRLLPPAQRRRIEPLAEAAKEQALDLRGDPDRPGAEADLRAANETLAAALVESAEADPEVERRRGRPAARRPPPRARAARERRRQGFANRLEPLNRLGRVKRPRPGSLPRDLRRFRPDTGAVSASRRRHARVPPGDEALPGPVRAGRRRAQPRGARGRDLRAGRAVGLRQDHGHADGQPHDRHHRRRHPARRAQRQGAQAGRAAARDRLRDPADRAVPPPERRRQHRHRAEAARLELATASARASTSCSSSSASTRTRRATATRRSSPAASASASAWPARSRSTRR